MQKNGVEQTEPPGSGAAVRFHDNIADVWDAKYRSGGFRKRAQFFQSHVLPRIEVRGKWLDAGCGSGYFGRLLAANGSQVTGIDASGPMIEAARTLSAEAGFGSALSFEIVPTVESLPFADANFDGCICLSVIEYLEKPEACLRELSRVIAPGGTLVLSVPHRWGPVRLTQRFAYSTMKSIAPAKWEFSILSRSALTKRELKAVLAASGFELLKTFDFDTAIPAGLLNLVPPGLIFVIAAKKGTGAGKPMES